MNKISTKDYSAYRVGDLILYNQRNEKKKDIGWIKNIIYNDDDHPDLYIIQWRDLIVNKMSRSYETEETIITMNAWEDSYVVSSIDD